MSSADNDLEERDEIEENSSSGDNNDDVLVGEYDENAGDDIAISSSSGNSRSEGMSSAELMKVPDKLLSIIESRISIYRQVETLDKQRQKIIDSGEDLPEEVINEIKRQNREAGRLPTAESARKQIERLMKILTATSEKVKRGEVPAIHPRLAETHRIAFKQWQICIKREELEPQIIEAGMELTHNEPLLRLLLEYGIRAQPLFGLAAYAVALEAGSTKANKKRRVVQANITALEQKNRGLLGRLRRADKDEEEEREHLRQSDELHNNTITYFSRERNSLESRMVKEYWEIYRQASNLLLQKELPREQDVVLRAFLRYGMISSQEHFLDRDVASRIYKDCQQAQRSFSYRMDEYHILYADEYLELIARGYCTPAIDENLELNERHSEAWKADRMHRRRISTLFREEAYTELVEILQEWIANLRKKQEKCEEKKAKLMRASPDYKQKNNELAQRIQHCKVEAARYQRAIDRINDKYMPLQLEQRSDAEAKLAKCEFDITPEYLIEREAKSMHRISRLCARLQDPFPPFALRDNFKPGTDAINDRETMLKIFREIEEVDLNIFKDVLMPVKKASQRIHMRFCPIILISPSCGFMGYSWNPRSGPEFGRLVLPLYMPRPGLRERILHDMLSDFRWDTSKASAGVDLLTSDTLVAAYSTVRWDYRKKSKEIREKAAIYSEENDRHNFRRHYSLFLQSARDAGKRLFFKCHEAYDVMVKYVGLPEGVEKLKR